MQITVAQHIFGNVPKDQSPSRKRGYQTLFYTRDALGREEMLRLEDHAQYYGDVHGPAKWQFWMLGERAVAARTTPLAEPDEFGRSGRYLTHSLVISAEDFRRLEYAPWPVFAAAPFVADLPAVYAQGDMSTGNHPALTLTVDPVAWEEQAVQAARAWPADILTEWARCGWQAAALKRARRAVSLEGDPASVWQALAVACALCPVEKRVHLSFDTYASGCDWRRAEWPFWVWAGLGTEAARADLRFAPTGGYVTAARPDADQDTPAERWLTRVAIPARLPRLRGQLRAAAQLSAALNGGRVDLASIDPAVAQPFAQLNANAIAHDVVQRLPVKLSPGLVQELEHAVRRDPWEAWRRSAASRSPRDVRVQIIAWLGLPAVQAAVTPADWASLASLAQEAGDGVLAAEWALAAGDVARWQALAADLSAEQYAQSAVDGLRSGRLTAETALTAPHLATWAVRCAPALQPGELKAVLKRMEKEPGLTAQADALTPLVEALTPDDRALLGKWAARRAKSAPHLTARLADVAAQSEREGAHWSERLKFWKRKGPEH